MAFQISRADYFYATVTDAPGEGYKVLSGLAGRGINLMAFTAVPFGPMHTQLTLFPEDTQQLQAEAKSTGLTLDGPHPALLARGDDELGALADIHKKLHDANVNVFASSGVTDGRGSYGYILYIRPEAFQRACEALDI